MINISKSLTNLVKELTGKKTTTEGNTPNNTDNNPRQLLTSTQGLDLSMIDETLLTDENKKILEKFKNNDFSVSGEDPTPLTRGTQPPTTDDKDTTDVKDTKPADGDFIKYPPPPRPYFKTTFESKQEFINYYGLDPNSADFEQNLEAAQRCMQENGIKTITINKIDFNVLTDADAVGNYSVISGTDKNDLILATHSKIDGNKGDDFIIAANRSSVDGGDGNDTIINKNGNSIGQNGDDFIYSNDRRYVSEGNDGNNTIQIGGTLNVPELDASVPVITPPPPYIPPADSTINTTTDFNGASMVFATTEEFFEHFGLSPNNEDYEQNLQAAQNYMQEHNIRKITIGQKEYNVLTDADINTNWNKIFGTNENDIIFTTANNKIISNDGEDILIGSNLVRTTDEDVYKDIIMTKDNYFDADSTYQFRTEFDSKEEFLNYFGLNPNSSDFRERILDLERFITSSRINIITIDGVRYNTVPIDTGSVAAGDATVKATQGVNGSDQNDLILSVAGYKILAGGGDDFIVSSGSDVYGGDGNDTIVSSGGNIDGGAGNNYIHTPGDGQVIESDDTPRLEVITQFATQQEFLDYFKIDPTQGTFEEKVREAQEFMLDHAISTITIGGVDYNVLVGDVDYGARYGTARNDLIFATTRNEISGAAGDDIIIAANANLYGGDGNDTIIAINSTIDGGAGDNYIYTPAPDATQTPAPTADPTVTPAETPTETPPQTQASFSSEELLDYIDTNDDGVISEEEMDSALDFFKSLGLDSVTVDGEEYIVE